MPHRLLKHAPRSKTSALRTAWQGAMKSRRVQAAQLCPLCRKPLTPQHMAMECKWWRGRVPPPPKHWERLKTKYPYECLWARGLMPAAATRLTGYLFGSASERAQSSCRRPGRPSTCTPRTLVVDHTLLTLVAGWWPGRSLLSPGRMVYHSRRE